MDLISKLNDRNLSFPDRCDIATLLLKPANPETISWSFPRKNQYIFDWFTGSLLKLARSESPRPEIFLNEKVWKLMKLFANILECENGSGSLKRPFNSITNDEEFFDFRKSFDSQVFVIKCPILTIFQTSLSLLKSKSSDSVDSDEISSIILSFLQQSRVTLPVSFSQVTDFIRSLVACQDSLSQISLVQILRPTLGILNEIVLGGAANYKKTYPLLVKFCLESAICEEEIWIEFISKCLFSQENIEELLTFLTSPSLISTLSENDVIVNESTFPKSLTFQRILFIELANEPAAFKSCPLIYEAFLRSAGTKINRETGFNFFTFLLHKTLKSNSSSASARFAQLAKLIHGLQSRGNEIYQQRNDQIYRNQSAVIEEIFDSALQVDPEMTPFPLLLSLAKLNYYLVAERLNSIFSRLNVSTEVIEFVVGMFELAALANQLPVLLEIILKSNLPVSVVSDHKLQAALIKIFSMNLSPMALHQIYLILSKDSTKSSLILLIPVIRSIVKVVDNVESFDKELYAKLQLRLLADGQPESLNLLAEIVRWSPGTFLLIDQLFNLKESQDYHMLNLIFTVKCKDSTKISCKSQIPFDLLLKYLPVIADDLENVQLESFSKWLLENEYICISTLKMMKFFEIKAMQKPFLDQLVVYASENVGIKKEFISQVISLLPWEYVNDYMAVELIKCLWPLPAAVSHLLRLPSPLNIRKETLKSLITHHLTAYVKFLFVVCAEHDDDDADLISKCFDVEHSDKLIKEVISKFESSTEPIDFKMKFVAKMLKFADFKSAELIKFIENGLNPVALLKDRSHVTVDFLDSLDIILEWIVDERMEMVASCILALPDKEGIDLEIAIRCQALRCKFPARVDMEFINESIEMASNLPESVNVTNVLKRDLVSLIKGLPVDRIKSLLELFLLPKNDDLSVIDIWKFTLALQSLNQLLQISTNVPVIFSLFNENLESIYALSLKFDKISSFLAVLKSIVQLRKNVNWDSRGIVNILGVLRKVRQAQPKFYEEIFVILRLLITMHLQHHRSLLPLLVSNICEAFSGVSSLEEAGSLGRILSELGSFRRGELEPFALLPILNAFISTKFTNPQFRKPLQISLSNLMYHLGTKKQLLQLLSTALVVEHEHRVILKSFIDEYNKFHKYSGRS